MGTDTIKSEYDAATEVALAAIRTFDGPLIIDFDETLYLRNSTEDFVDCARPSLAAALLLRLLDVAKPWRITGHDTRDNWRVCAISVLFPWIYWRWRKKVPALADKYVNRELLAALQSCNQAPTILTAGFGRIVAPLLAAMRVSDARLIAARVYPFADRRNGKLDMAMRELGAASVAEALVLTDSINDRKLLERCRKPLRTLWPDADYRHALASVYLPGEYISQIKRPGTRYILRGILQEDFAFWLLSSIGLAVNPAAHVCALCLLLLSFWAIYERGYVDNDLVASRHEAEPKLSSNFGRVTVSTPAVEPWIWATLSGAAAISLVYHDLGAFSLRFGCWMTFLVLMHACYLAYNRFDKMTRVWLYPLLQWARTAAFTVVVPIEPAGVAALGAHMLSRWVPYQIYRVTSGSWPDARTELARLVSFVLLLGLFTACLGLAPLFTWSALALLLWNLFRARSDIWAVFRSARRLDRSSSPSRSCKGRDMAESGQPRVGLTSS
jgi:hypothetical protein